MHNYKIALCFVEQMKNYIGHMLMILYNGHKYALLWMVRETTCSDCLLKSSHNS